MHGWQANKKRTCASPVVGRAMPENEKPPAMRVDIYYCLLFHQKFIFFRCKAVFKRQICFVIEVAKPQEYFVYFKVLRQRDRVNLTLKTDSALWSEPPNGAFYADLSLSDILSAIIAINSELVGLPRLFWIV